MIYHLTSQLNVLLKKFRLFKIANHIPLGGTSPSIRVSLLLTLFYALLPFTVQARSTVDTDTRPLRVDQIDYGEIDRVDPWSGNLVLRHKDLSLPGNGGLDIEVWRNYDMRSASTGLASTHLLSYRWAALGPGWSLNVAPRIVFDHHYNMQGNTPIYMESGLLELCANRRASNWNFPPHMTTLEMPNGETQTLYMLDNYKAQTKNGWKVDCISNNVKLTSPQGVVYDMGNITTDRRIGKHGIHKDDHYYLPIEIDTMFTTPLNSSSYMSAKSAKNPAGNILTYKYIDFGAPFSALSTASVNAYLTVYNTPTSAEIEKPSRLLSSITSSDGRSVNFSYDPASGRLLSMTDNAGRTWTYSYLTPDALNSRTLSKVTIPTGASWAYNYAPGSFVASGISSLPNTIPLDTAGVTSRKLVGLTFPSGGKISYEYDFYNWNSPLGGSVVFVRGERIKKRTLSTGDTWAYGYTRGGAGAYDTTKITGPEGTTTYKYMGPGFSITTTAPRPNYQNNAWRVGSLMEKTYPNGALETYTWQPRLVANSYTRINDLGHVHDAAIWAADLQKRTVTRGGTTYTTTYSNYDIYGNPGIRTEAGPNGGSRTTTLSYFNDPAKWIIGHLKSEVSPGVSMTRTFDANGKVLTETRDGVTTKFSYDAQGNIASKTTPGGRVYTYSNYKRGIAQTETHPEGITLTRVVDNVGNITSETNGEGKTTTYTYDGLNRQTSFTPPVGSRETIAYTPTSKTATRGALVEKTVYGPFGHPASVTLAGVTRTFTYDGLGRKTFESNPGVATGTRYQYDALNRLTRQTNADGTFQSRTYGPANMSVVDERGKTTTYTYRAYGNPDKQLLMAIAAPEASANVSIERSPNGLMTAVTQGGRKRTYGYDAHNYLISVTNPETGITTYGRDIAGNMITKKVGASGITKYTYDALDRLKSTVYPGTTPAITNTYNKDSKLLTSNASGGNRSFAYDAAGNLIQESLALDGKVFTAKYAYNGNDQLSSITYPQSGRVVSYTPDALGRPTTVSGYVTNVKYWPSGLIQSVTYSNGTVSTYGQNARLWPTNFVTQKTATAGVYLNSSYTYDGVGNLATIKDTADSSFNRTLGYDNINRLTSAVGFWGQGSITYDGGGNLTKQTLGQSSLAYVYDTSNRLSSVSGLRASTFGYDAYGNVSSSLGNTYTYNDVPNLTCINCAVPAKKVEYSYDGLNHRSAVTKASGKVYEMHDSNGKPLIELDAGVLTEYLYLGDKRIAQRVSP
ncbi:hypothetical protein [Pseudomonas sp. Z1-12]|uniref:hypothetical protein n=1 Tax=Pseudomonas sp. Z1-12 TaxID=2817408 RepID=UPI003DA80B2D